MPIKHAALRQLRKDRPRAVRNQAVASALKTLTKRIRALMAQQKREEAQQLLPTVAKGFDQAAAKGVIHKNTASRMKSRLTRQLAKTASAPRSAAPGPSAESSGPS